MGKRILLFAVASLLMSCGGDKKTELTVTPETTEIKGPLKGCYEVVLKDYTIQQNSWSALINVELKRTNKELPFDPQEASSFDVYNDIQVGFGIELIDEDGEVVEITNANATGLSGPYSSDDIDAAINLAPGEIGIVRWSVDMDNEPASFRITSAVSKGKNNSGHSSSVITEPSTIKESSNDWDKVLDKYEQYVDKYIAISKKAMNGDLSASMEYIDLLEDAKELGDELDSASDEKSPEQISRYTRITKKLSNIATESVGF